MVDDLVEFYIDENNLFWVNLYKVIFVDSKNKVDFLCNLRDKIEEEGSEKGFDVFK